MTENPKLTSEAAERLAGEIEQLEGEGRREIAGRIGIAREWGDLKENAEYHAAKEEAAMLEARIARLRRQLSSAEIVEAVRDGEAAGMGSMVTYSDARTGREQTYRLVPAIEASPSNGRLSIDSPVGRALEGSKAGDTRILDTPSGEREISIVSVRQS